MVIEIHRPELEALITERLLSGPYHTVTDLLLHALKAAPAKNEGSKPQPKNVIEFFRKLPEKREGPDYDTEF